MQLMKRGAASVASCLAYAALASCASPGMPPGGPLDSEAPQIVRMLPDSGKTGTTPRNVVFRFNEVVSERPSGVPSLAGLFLISPRDGEPKVDWGRTQISVRPRKGWRKNTAYTITLLPGLSDLRGNTRNTGAVTQFATGASIPAGRISGTFYNWAEGRAVPRALIEARPATDTTLVYITAADSAGNFVLSTLPPGSYRVRGIGDENANKGLDPREAWDSATVGLRDSARTDLYGFVHDSLGSRIVSLTVTDSVTLEISFDNPLVSAPALGVANIRVRASDSTDVPILSVSPPPPDTAITKAMKLARAIPPRSLVVKLARPLRPRADYRVRVTDARNLMGVVRSSDRVVSVPAAQPPAPPPPPPPPPLPAPAAVRR